jgi:F420-dependent oxidoreductase-like protein
MYSIDQLRIFTEPQQGASYDDLLAVARRAEALGFGAFFRSDHFLSMGDALPNHGLPGPSDSWVTLAGLARDTTSIRLGTLVSSATFRQPGVLAISVANVDQMSGGRVELGLGAGWYREEHEAYGIYFPDLGERFDRLAEQLAILTGLWSTPPGGRYEFAGRHYALRDSPALPKPLQQPVPIIVGGGGKKRTPALAAAYASEFNIGFRSLDEFRAQRDRVRAACDAAGRDPDTIAFSTAIVAAVGETGADAARRAARIGRDADDLRRTAVAGTAGQAAATLEAWQEAGADRVYLQVLDLSDLEHLDVISSIIG